MKNKKFPNKKAPLKKVTLLYSFLLIIKTNQTLTINLQAYTAFYL